jgi:Glycosyl transferases group 1
MEHSVICFGEDWNRHPGSAQDIMERLSETHKVLWIDSLGLRPPKFTMEDGKRIVVKIRNWLKGSTSVQKSLVVFTPLVLPFYGSRIVRMINNLILRISIRHLMKKHDLSEPILWVSCPAAEGVIGYLGEKKCIYYCADEHSVFPGLSNEVVSTLEERLFQKADTVIVTSKNLYDRKKGFNSNIHYIPHGVDFELFSKAAKADTLIPEDIREIKKPIIGFYGLIQDLIDFELIRYVAKTRPDWSLVLIGPTIFDAGELPSEKNIYFLGRRNREELPNYVKGFDVCMIPYKLVDRTIYANPLKLRQYLASGKPIVSTALPEVFNYAHLVKIAANKEEYVNHIATLLKHDPPKDGQKRMEAVRGESWDHIMKQIERLL